MLLINLNLIEEVHRACINDNSSNILLAAKESNEVNSEVSCNNHPIQLVILKAIKNSVELSKAMKNLTELASHTHIETFSQLPSFKMHVKNLELRPEK